LGGCQWSRSINLANRYWVGYRLVQWWSSGSIELNQPIIELTFTAKLTKLIPIKLELESTVIIVKLIAILVIELELKLIVVTTIVVVKFPIVPIILR